MKAIISRDIDHITPWEHFTRDLIIPKFIVRSKIKMLTGKNSFSELSLRDLSAGEGYVAALAVDGHPHLQYWEWSEL